MRNKIFLTIALFFGIVGCAPDLGHDDYGLENQEMTNIVYTGTVKNVRSVKVHRRQKGAISEGAVGGATAGGLLGALGGGGGWKSAGFGALGAAAGGTAGYLIDEKTRTQKAFEYIIKLDTGEEISTIQTGDIISVNSRVRVYVPQKSGARARLVPIG